MTILSVVPPSRCAWPCLPQGFRPGARSMGISPPGDGGILAGCMISCAAGRPAGSRAGTPLPPPARGGSRPGRWFAAVPSYPRRARALIQGVRLLALGWVHRPAVRSVLTVSAGRGRAALAGGHMLQFVNGEVVVAFGSQPGRHSPGSGSIAGIFDHLGGGRTQALTLAFFRSRMPAPACATRAALSGWSRPSGTTTSGTPAIRAFITVPWPP